MQAAAAFLANSNLNFKVVLIDKLEDQIAQAKRRLDDFERSERPEVIEDLRELVFRKDTEREHNAGKEEEEEEDDEGVGSGDNEEPSAEKSEESDDEDEFEPDN